MLFLYQCYLHYCCITSVNIQTAFCILQSQFNAFVLGIFQGFLKNKWMNLNDAFVRLTALELATTCKPQVMIYQLRSQERSKLQTRTSKSSSCLWIGRDQKAANIHCCHYSCLLTIVLFPDSHLGFWGIVTLSLSLSTKINLWKWLHHRH